MPLCHTCKDSPSYYLLSYMEAGQPQMLKILRHMWGWWYFKLFPEMATGLWEAKSFIWLSTENYLGYLRKNTVQTQH